MQKWMNVYLMLLRNKIMKIVIVSTVDTWMNKISKYLKILTKLKDIISSIRKNTQEESDKMIISLNSLSPIIKSNRRT